MLSLALIASLIGFSSAHYTFPWLNVNGVNSTYWAHTRVTNNYNSLNPVTDVKSSDIRCYDSAPGMNSNPTALAVAAGTTVNVGSDPGGVCCGQYHQSIAQVYLALVPSGQDPATWEPTNAVWFKVGEMAPITDGGNSITWTAMSAQYAPFTIPKDTPSGTYLVRTENVALQSASGFGGAQFYISCSIIQVTGGGSGSPGPLVAFPGAYTGNEPGLLLNIFYPIPPTYTMPGPAMWTGGGSSGGSTGTGSTSSPSGTTKTPPTTTPVKTTTATGPTQSAYGQCGGAGWSGATTCTTGYKCLATNAYYSQCVPS